MNTPTYLGAQSDIGFGRLFSVNIRRKRGRLKSAIQNGFSLIELMIVVAIIGIAAAVALPTYQDYRVRSLMSGVIMRLEPLKKSAAEYYTVNGTFPVTLSAGVSTAESVDTGGEAYTFSMLPSFILQYQKTDNNAVLNVQISQYSLSLSGSQVYNFLLVGRRASNNTPTIEWGYVLTGFYVDGRNVISLPRKYLPTTADIW